MRFLRPPPLCTPRPRPNREETKKLSLHVRACSSGEQPHYHVHHLPVYAQTQYTPIFIRRVVPPKKETPHIQDHNTHYTCTQQPSTLPSSATAQPYITHSRKPRPCYPWGIRWYTAITFAGRRIVGRLLQSITAATPRCPSPRSPARPPAMPLLPNPCISQAPSFRVCCSQLWN
jgi:hypothetical protein